MAAYQRRTLSLYIEKPTRKTDKKNSRREQIWAFCNEAKSASEILELLGLKNKENAGSRYARYDRT